MRLRLCVSFGATVGALALAAPAFAHGTATGPCASGGVTASTASYRMALVIGKQEEMYLASEVKARHIKTGEIMLGGEMAMVDMPPAGTKVFHLEVHICTPSGAVVTKLTPRIVAGKTVLPAAIMVGVGAPISDYHYGNDIALKPGAALTVTVAVKGQTAVFKTTVPKT
ncbi:MAG: hypothetical protein WCH31_09895 [Actinomycetes bacterium]